MNLYFVRHIIFFSKQLKIWTYSNFDNFLQDKFSGYLNVILATFSQNKNIIIWLLSTTAVLSFCAPKLMKNTSAINQVICIRYPLTYTMTTTSILSNINIFQYIFTWRKLIDIYCYNIILFTVNWLALKISIVLRKF